MYNYEIKLTKDKKLLTELEISFNQMDNLNYPTLIPLENGKKFLFLHGDENGNYYANDQTISSNDVINMFGGMFIICKTIWTICCYGGYMTDIINPLGISVKSIFKSEHTLYYILDFKNNKMLIQTKEKVKIPKELLDVINYTGFTK